MPVSSGRFVERGVEAGEVVVPQTLGTTQLLTSLPVILLHRISLHLFKETSVKGITIIISDERAENFKTINSGH